MIDSPDPSRPVDGAMTLAALGAAEAVRRLAAGEITSEELTGACLARVGEVDGDIQAWTHLDPEAALAQARGIDDRRRAGRPLGPLAGLPIGVKDIFDTADMPTENGSPLHAGRKPGRDAAVVALLRAAGAVVLGKTVTTEFAVYSPGKTRNPHNSAHTPGGSSSGSAAAVAAGMVPGALGSQTNASIVRPASFCGVYGYKPTHGLIPRPGVLALSRALDTVGLLARSVADLALLAAPMMAYDARDPDMRPMARRHLVSIATSEPPEPPRFAFVRTPWWDRADPATRTSFEGLAARLGDACNEVSLPEIFDNALEQHRTIMTADLARSLAKEYETGRAELSETLRGLIEDGQKVPAVDYNRAIDQREVLNAALDTIFGGYDAILTPAAVGEAPAGLGSTGDPLFCTLWTYCATPAVSLPLLRGESGLPLGVQLVGERGDDERLLRTANWLARTLGAGPERTA